MTFIARRKLLDITTLCSFFSSLLLFFFAFSWFYGDWKLTGTCFDGVFVCSLEKKIYILYHELGLFFRILQKKAPRGVVRKPIRHRHRRHRRFNTLKEYYKCYE
jgi:hypothetical protein